MTKKRVKKSSKKWHALMPGKRQWYIPAAIFACLAIAGVMMILRSYAATSVVAQEAESGTVAGAAAAATMTGASGERGVRFGGGASGETVTIAAAGDIADNNGEKATSDLIVNDPSIKLVLALGDNAYENGTRSDFDNKYHPTWGRFKAMTKPTPGNHEYQTSGASGYFSYFNNIASYYSFDFNGWHFVSLNSNVTRSSGSTQHTWYKNDLAANAGKQCTIAFWHHPRYSAGTHSDDSSVQPFFQASMDANVDIILAGHSHIYERFARSNATGGVDNVKGVRNFVVGTGGASLGSGGRTSATREFNTSRNHGVLKLDLGPTSYKWRFVATNGQTLDQGTENCH